MPRSPRAKATQTGCSKMKKLTTAAKQREREDRADRKIDAAAQHDDGQAGHDDRELAELAGGIAERGRLEEAGDGGAEDRDGDDQRHERNRVVRPALGEDLADQMIGDVVVAQAQQPARARSWQ